MRDTNAVARPAEDPDTVLPYDPDDWERRLAEARKRREAVLRRRAAMAEADPDPARTRDTAPAPAAASPPSPEVAPDPEVWRRRLAEARGIAATDGATPAPAAPAATAPRPRPAPQAVAPSNPAKPDAAPVDDAPRYRAGTGRALLAGLGGLAAGVALTLVLVGPDASTPTETRAADPVIAPAGIAAAAPTVTGLHEPPAVASPPASLPATADTVTALSTPTLPPVPGARAVVPRPPPDAVVAGPPPPATGIEAQGLNWLGRLPATAQRPAPLPAAADAVPARSVPGQPPLPALRGFSATLMPPAARPSTAPPPDGAAAPDPAAPFVVLHVPSAPAPGTGASLSESRAAGWPVVPVDFTVSRSHLRVYHDGDRAAAAALGARLGLPVRDFVGVVPAPQGLIEVWIAGAPKASD